MNPRTLIPYAALAGVWIAFLAPSVLLNQWFTLDVGGIFSRAAIYPHNLAWTLLPDTPYNIGGRYFPAYWLYNFMLVRLFSTNIAAHFAVQSVLFALALGLTCYLFFRTTRNLKATLVLGVIACLGGAVAENLYTLCKPEPLAYLSVIAILSIFHGIDPGKRGRSALQFAAIAVLAALAMWFKETSLVLLVLCPAALAASAFILRVRLARWRENPFFRRYALLFASLVGGLAVAKAPSLFTSSHPTLSRSHITYLEYDIDQELVTDNLVFYATQQPDVLLIGLAAVFLCGMAALRLRAEFRDVLLPSTSNLIFVIGLLAMAWGYYLGLMIWRWPMGYYMLLPSIAFKFCALYGLVLAIEGRLLGPRAVRSLVGGLALCVAYAGIHSFYVASSQITYSRLYTEAISRYMAVSKPTNRLIFESFPFYSEQVNNTRELINVISGETRLVSGIADLLNPAVTAPKILKLLDISQAQLDNNELSLPDKDDYLLLMTGNKLATWFVRGVTPYFSDDSILRKDDAYEMIPVAEGRMFTPTAFLNVWTDRLYFGPTYFGYKLYRITSDRPRLIWRGRYPDGWVGKSASIRLFPEFGSRARVTVSTPEFNSPNRVVVSRDGVLVADLPLVGGKEVVFEVANNAQENPSHLRFSVERTVVPKALKLNKDTRELGVLVRVEPLR